MAGKATQKAIQKILDNVKMQTEWADCTGVFVLVFSESEHNGASYQALSFASDEVLYNTLVDVLERLEGDEDEGYSN